MILIIERYAAVRSSLTFLLKRAGLNRKLFRGRKRRWLSDRQTTLQLILMDIRYTTDYDR